jgi:hypothetical protein
MAVPPITPAAAPAIAVTTGNAPDLPFEPALSRAAGLRAFDRLLAFDLDWPERDPEPDPLVDRDCVPRVFDRELDARLAEEESRAAIA